MTNAERLNYFKAALAILNINFEKDETYISILAMVDLVDSKEGKTSLKDIMYENELYQKNYDFRKLITNQFPELSKREENTIDGLI